MRSKSTRRPPVLTHLPDGSCLSDLHGLSVRIIDAELTVTAIESRRRRCSREHCTQTSANGQPHGRLLRSHGRKRVTPFGAGIRPSPWNSSVSGLARRGAGREAAQEAGQASAALEPARASTPMEAAASGRPVAEPTTDGVTMPDETWSVVQLRAEARARGLVRMSNKPKAQLLTALS